MIPKIVHISWNDKNLLLNDHPLVTNGIKSFNYFNPDWSIVISNDNDIDNYLKDNLTNFEYSLVKDINIVAKTDIWRLLKIYNEGGLYMDIDRLCNKNISYLFDEHTKWVLPTCKDQDFSHDIMISDKNNPVFKNVIQMYFKRREQGINHIYFLGATTYMHGITSLLMGEIIDYNPGVEIFNKIRQTLSKYSFIKTFRESPPENTVLYTGNLQFDDLEAMKRSFYKENNIKHWTGEW